MFLGVHFLRGLKEFYTFSLAMDGSLSHTVTVDSTGMAISVIGTNQCIFKFGAIIKMNLLISLYQDILVMGKCSGGRLIAMPHAINTFR